MSCQPSPKPKTARKSKNTCALSSASGFGAVTQPWNVRPHSLSVIRHCGEDAIISPGHNAWPARASPSQTNELSSAKYSPCRAASYASASTSALSWSLAGPISPRACEPTATNANGTGGGPSFSTAKVPNLFATASAIEVSKRCVSAAEAPRSKNRTATRAASR